MMGQEGTEPLPMNHTTFREVIAMNLRTNDPITLDIAQHLFATEDEVRRLLLLQFNPTLAQ